MKKYLLESLKPEEREQLKWKFPGIAKMEKKMASSQRQLYHLWNNVMKSEEDYKAFTKESKKQRKTVAQMIYDLHSNVMKNLFSRMDYKTKITKVEIEAFKLVTGWYGEFDICKLADDGILPWDKHE